MSAPKLNLISEQDFSECCVYLDGNNYVDCSFTNVIIVWQGGPFILNKIRGSNVSLQTANKVIKEVLDLLNILGLLKNGIKESK